MAKKSKSGAKNETKSRGYYGLHAWKCEPDNENCKIVAYVEASGRWETVAVIPPTSGAMPEALANFITRQVNDRQECADLLLDAMSVLEEILGDGQLDFSTEHDADRVVGRIKKIEG